jgi:hypothetical protein
MANAPAPTRPHTDRSARFTLLLRAAKLIGPAGEYLCILRDVSATGLKLRLFHPLPGGDALEIELANGDRYRIEPVWQARGHAGFRFADGEVALEPLLREQAQFPKRAIRLRSDLPGLLHCEGGACAAILRDISQDGARIECDLPLAIGQALTIEAAPFPPLRAHVRWRKGTAHGVSFVRHFALDELARLLAAATDESPAIAAAR